MGAEAALDTLVEQFSDPLSFYRELIQNAIDAGTPAIDVRLELGDPGPDGKAVMVIHVDDYGEGMDREIIDKRLTRLFSSSKDGDLTKIGRFGIGFVSVFGVRPDAVCVDTSRGGETWRVLFEADRTFSCIARDEPVDGTKIRVIKAIDPATFADFERRSRDVITYWCAHVDSEISFQGDVVNRALDVDALCVVKDGSRDTGTEIVAGYILDPGAEQFGFYNKGLTLLEGTGGEHHPGVSFKVSSRYLEHTLTRDNVLRDDQFDKAMDRVAALVSTRLPAALFDQIERTLNDPEATAAEAEPLYRLAARLATTDEIPTALDERAVAWSAAGGTLSVETCRRAGSRGRLYRADVAGPVAAEVVRQGLGVVALAPVGSPPLLLLEALARAATDDASAAAVTCPCVDDVWCLPRPTEDDHGDEARAPDDLDVLAEALVALLRADGAKVAGVVRATFGYPGSTLGDRLVISQRKPGGLAPLSEARELGRSLLSSRRWLVMNAASAELGRLGKLAAREPELAAYLAAKRFYLDEDVDGARDGGLARAAYERRAGRLAREPD